jgi:mannose-6-phosphate isomerase-like protein (cupin superfamily)
MPEANGASGKRLWFFANLAEIKLAQEASGGVMSVVDFMCPPGDMPPLHVHRNDDEVWAILEGEVSFWVGPNDPVRVPAGGVAFGPKGVPHTYRIEGNQPARMLVTCTPGEFSKFVDAASRPAERPELPPEPEGPPSEEDLAAMGQLAASHGIDLLGPPGALPGDTPAE